MRDYSALYDSRGDGEVRDVEHVQTRRHRAYAIAEADPTLTDPGVQWTPELQLMMAILDDAIACYCKTLKRPRQNPEILARQAEFWFRLDDWDSPFSFNNVCEALGMDAEALRDRIFARGEGLDTDA